MAEQQFAKQLIAAAQIVESQLDEKLAALDSRVGKLDDDAELEELRRKRVTELKAQQREKERLTSIGHGKLMELADEREFFSATKDSERVICYFYDPQDRKSEVVEKILHQLAAKHFGTRFIRLNAEKVPFLIKRLNIRRLPTLGLCISSQMVDFVRAGEVFGPTIEDITLEAMEKRLAEGGIIDAPPPSSAVGKGRGGVIRGVTLPGGGGSGIRGAAGSRSMRGDCNDWQ